MRLHIVVTCVAGAVCLVSVGSRAEPYNVTIASARSPSAARSEISAEKHMSAHNLAHGEEEEERVVTTAQVELALDPLKWDESLSRFLSQDMKAVDLCKLLELHKALEQPVNHLLVTFKLEYLEKYMELYNKKNGNDPTTLAETLSNLWDSNDTAKKFYKKFLEAEGRPLTHELKWLRRKKTPAEVFTLLHPKISESEAVLRIERLTQWISYAEAFDTVYNEHELIKHLFTLGFTDTILADKVIPLREPRKDGQNKERLFKALTKFWLAENLDPNSVFRLLGLDNVKAKASILEGFRIQKWMDFVNEFNDKTTEPKKSYLSRLELLMEPEFSKDDLMEMLRKKKKSPTTQRIAANHQQQLEKERVKLNEEDGHDKADLDKIDKQLDAMRYLTSMKRKRNAKKLASPTDN